MAFAYARKGRNECVDGADTEGVEASGWFGVRCIFAVGEGERAGSTMYEERVTIWRAASVDDAIRLAEADAVEYAGVVDSEYLAFAQAYVMADDVGSGAEVFSLVRESALGAADYVSAFFDTGDEFDHS